MKSSVRTFADLGLGRDALLSEILGPQGVSPDAHALASAVLQEGMLLCKPRYSFCSFDDFEPLSASCFRLAGVEFRAGKIITQALSCSDRIYLLVATAGKEFETWIEEQKSDIMRLFVADALGSAVAEATARLAEQDIASREELTTNPYSPGYCNWHVSEQQKFFSLLPPAPSGVMLNASSLMQPIKSVSSMVGSGPRVVRQPYGCAICRLTTCYKRAKNSR